MIGKPRLVVNERVGLRMQVFKSQANTGFAYFKTN